MIVFQRTNPSIHSLNQNAYEADNNIHVENQSLIKTTHRKTNDTESDISSRHLLRKKLNSGYGLFCISNIINSFKT